MKVRCGAVLVFAFLALASLAHPAAGQLRIVPQVGLYGPVSEFGTVSTAEGARELGQRNASFAWGGALELGGDGATSFRVNGLYGTDGEVPVGGIGCGEGQCDTRSTLLTLTGTVSVRPVPGLTLLQPYLLLGGGAKRYQFEVEEGADLRDELEDGSELTGQLGLGAEWSLGSVRGLVEVSDFVSGSFLEGEGGDAQHDFFVTVGLIIG